MTHYDVIIIGGGINGAGIARDAAMRGLQVLLLERDDFASGASGKNGRMIHGGLRYLEQMEIGLVREALSERNILLKIAPHLVTRRDLIIPIRSNIGRPSWMVRLGLIGLDILSLRPSTFHRYLKRSAVLRRMPSFNPEGLQGAAVMFDAFVAFAERLVLENIIDAARHGAVALNHSCATKLITDGVNVTGVAFKDQSGHAQIAHAPVVVNATGAWADEFLGVATSATSDLLGPAKGSFLVIRNFEGAPDGSVFFEAAEDRRPIIVTPWNGHYLVGTTDVRFTGPVDDVSASQEEVTYLLTELARCFPKVGAGDVLYTYTGVRPLPRASGVSSKVPRQHIIHDHANIPGLLTILGGKLSTFRSLSAEAVDIVFARLAKKKVACRTAKQALPGSDNNYSTGQKNAVALTALTQNRLADIYGTRTALLLELVAGDPSLAKIIDEESGAISAEIVFAVQEEWAVTFEDILVRRTMIGRNSQLGLNALDAVAEIAHSHLGWNAQRIHENRENYYRYIEFSLGFTHYPGFSAPARLNQRESSI